MENTVVPLLLLGLAETVKERWRRVVGVMGRPNNPVEFLANFLLQNNPQVKHE